MKEIVISGLRIFFSGSIAVTTFLVTYLLGGIEIVPALVLGGVAYFVTSKGIQRRFALPPARHSLIDGTDPHYLEKTHKEARRKWKVIGRYRFKVRSLSIWLKVTRLYKIAEQILDITEKDLRQISKVQSFFNHYLDATVTILDKYSLLSSQPISNDEIRNALEKTHAGLQDLIHAYEEQLNKLLAKDLLELEVEVNVLKQTLDSKGEKK
ncbi:conserved hypothetical protein [Heliomicrobium modesticaldum Ice1]|uniref:5-bromo-4-chloroindolyl phosphate hydrolysis protein n=1 Tax=Heliobacterium modesticaldum (strain ATCC 51547 / Ice1) TaxID=498761 RepID=B0THW1_HELMI|nr:5-bromo-4-chloroindolyl phosphate hydrolysis family protein [Heliomicrobium modesticaldum]ABZ82634.1 conserved hypothetical protein [Heliomicrobium modesticaldum Ice1]